LAFTGILVTSLLFKLALPAIHRCAGCFLFAKTLGDGNVLAHILAIPVLPIFTAQLSKNTASKEKAQSRIHTELPECTAATAVIVTTKIGLSR